MSSHQLDFLQKYANRVVYLEKGHLMEENSVTKINWQKIRDNLRQAQREQGSDAF
jgi:ABC-type methionine transport system ATPase subunit